MKKQTVYAFRLENIPKRTDNLEILIPRLQLPTGDYETYLLPQSEENALLRALSIDNNTLFEGNVLINRSFVRISVGVSSSYVLEIMVTPEIRKALNECRYISFNGTE